MLSILNTYLLLVRQKHTVTIRLQDIRLILSDLPQFLDTSNSSFPDTPTHTKHTRTHTHNTT